MLYKVSSWWRIERSSKWFNENWRFPNCGRVIDRCYIAIIAPTDFHSDFYNRKGWFFMVLQGVADQKYHFIDVYTGWLGSVYDARVFANSPITNWRKLV